MASRLAVVSLWVVALAGVAGLVRLVLVVGAPPPAPPAATIPAAPSGPPPVSPPSGQGWTVVHQLSAHHILVLEVETDRLDQAKAIAQQLAEPVKPRYSEILIYFYRPGRRGTLAPRRVQWTPAGGYVVVDYEHDGARD